MTTDEVRPGQHLTVFRVSRKRRTCEDCHGPIERGERYSRLSLPPTSDIGPLVVPLRPRSRLPGRSPAMTEPRTEAMYGYVATALNEYEHAAGVDAWPPEATYGTHRPDCIHVGIVARSIVEAMLRAEGTASGGTSRTVRPDWTREEGLGPTPIDQAGYAETAPNDDPAAGDRGLAALREADLDAAWDAHLTEELGSGHECSRYCAEDLVRFYNAALPHGEPARTPEWWLIKYEDPDRPPEVYDDRDTARRRFRDIGTSWNATLFASVEDNYSLPLSERPDDSASRLPDREPARTPEPIEAVLDAALRQVRLELMQDVDPDAVITTIDSALLAAGGAPELIECETCGGSGAISGIGADPLPSGEPGEPYQTQESCPDCGGGGVRPSGRTALEAVREGWEPARTAGDPRVAVLRTAVLALVDEVYWPHHQPSSESGPEEWDVQLEAPNAETVERVLNEMKAAGWLDDVAALSSGLPKETRYRAETLSAPRDVEIIANRDPAMWAWLQDGAPRSETK